MRKIIAKLVYALARVAGLFVYKYPKADATSTVVVLFDNGTNTLVIERGHEPFAGMLAFPGGFLNIGTETLRRAAKRELKEETSIDLPEDMFIPVDTRSDPGRDPRGHVIDHGWLVIVPPEMKAAVLAQLKHDDDASDAFVQPVQTLLGRQMAFDHAQLLTAALALFKRRTTSR